jgi:hypothetical protein
MPRMICKQEPGMDGKGLVVIAGVILMWSCCAGTVHSQLEGLPQS